MTGVQSGSCDTNDPNGLVPRVLGLFESWGSNQILVDHSQNEHWYSVIFRSSLLPVCIALIAAGYKIVRLWYLKTKKPLQLLSRFLRNLMKKKRAFIEPIEVWIVDSVDVSSLCENCRSKRKTEENELKLQSTLDSQNDDQSKSQIMEQVNRIVPESIQRVQVAIKGTGKKNPWLKKAYKPVAWDVFSEKIPATILRRRSDNTPGAPSTGEWKFEFLSPPLSQKAKTGTDPLISSDILWSKSGLA